MNLIEVRKRIRNNKEKERMRANRAMQKMELEDYIELHTPCPDECINVDIRCHVCYEESEFETILASDEYDCDCESCMRLQRLDPSKLYSTPLSCEDCRNKDIQCHVCYEHSDYEKMLFGVDNVQ